MHLSYLTSLGLLNLMTNSTTCYEWKSPPGIGDSCEYVEKAVVDS